MEGGLKISGSKILKARAELERDKSLKEEPKLARDTRD